MGPNTNENLAVNSVARLSSAAYAISQVAEPAFPLISGAYDAPIRVLEIDFGSSDGWLTLYGGGM
jgi:hypothetical protein